MNEVEQCRDPKKGPKCDRRIARARSTNEFARRASFEWGEVDKVYAMSDIHGDARLLLLSLLRIGVIGDAISLEWTGGLSLVVICGDLIDDCRRNCANARGGDAVLSRRMELGEETKENDGANEWEVLALLNVLVAKGARIVWVMGNHELMRMQEASSGESGSRRAYQRHVTRDYEERRLREYGKAGRTTAAWSKEGHMARLFGPLRCVVTVGNVVFIHADPVDVRKSVHFDRDREYATAREYAEHVNRVVAMHRDSAFTGTDGRGSMSLVWGRRLGHGFRPGKCNKIMPRHIRERTFVVRGHCITGSANREARGVTIDPMLKKPASEPEHFIESGNYYEKLRGSAALSGSAAATTSGAKLGITFGCLEFAKRDGRKRGIVSGVARVDCGASASIAANDHMGVLEIVHLGNGAVALSQIRFAADGT
jgi:predicted phosphodiesterase